MVNFFDINMGHLITIVGGIGSLMAVWFKIRYKLDDIAQQVEKQERALEEINRMALLVTLNQHERRLASVEANQGHISAMCTDIEWIKATLGKVELQMGQYKQIQ